MNQLFGLQHRGVWNDVLINLHACYCTLFANIEQKLPFLFAGIK